MKKFLRRFNWISFLSTVALVVIGALVLASAGDARGADTVFASLWKKMVATAGLGFVLYFTFAILDYRKVLDYLAYPSYAGAIFFLLLVLAVGSVQFGGRRWLWFFQPSEISKLCVICCLAQLFGPAEERFRGQFGFKGFLAAAAILYFDYHAAAIYAPLLRYPIAAIGILLLALAMYVFALQARYENTIGGTLKNAVSLAIAYFPRTLGIVVFTLAFWLLAIHFYRFGIPVLVLFGLSLPCYVGSLLLRGVFEKLEKET